VKEVGADIVAMREYLYSLMELPPDAVVLDAGCGAGQDLRQIGQRVSGGARLIGLTLSDRDAASARQATAEDARCDFSAVDLSQGIPFEDGLFDVVYSNNLLECLTDKQGFLAEVHRVLKSDGQIVCAHWDHDSHTIDGGDKGLVREVVHAFADWKQAWMADADGWMGRRLWRTFQRSRLFAGSIQTYVLTNTVFTPPWHGYETITSFAALVRRGLISQAQYDALLRAVHLLADRDEYFYSVTLYIYVGRKIGTGSVPGDFVN
jgi:SAM-dependent methyltransferase